MAPASPAAGRGSSVSGARLRSRANRRTDVAIRQRPRRQPGTTPSPRTRSAGSSAADDHYGNGLWGLAAHTGTFGIEDALDLVGSGVEPSRCVDDDVFELTLARHLAARGREAITNAFLIIETTAAQALLKLIE